MAFTSSELAERTLQRRAVEAAIWAIPAVNYDAMYQAMVRDAKGGFNQVIYWSRPSDWKNQTLTPNTDALYLIPFINTKEVGPMVLEIPPADEGTIVGTVMDCWQIALEDVGAAGVDRGKGGKYLTLPPAYRGIAPPEYIVLPSNNYEGYALLRSIPKSGSEADIAKAVAYLKRVKLYPLWTAGNPPQTTFLDVNDVVFDANIAYDQRFFEALDRIVQVEPWLERDRVMIDMLKSIGIEKGKRFAPDAKTVDILKAAVQEAHAWLASRYESAFEPFYPGTHWFFPAEPEMVDAVATSFKTTNTYPIDSRGTTYYYAFSSVKHMGVGQYYLFVTRDKSGHILNGGKSYRLVVPPKVPVKQYWSATAYDFATHALIRNVDWASRSSLTPGLKTNAEGSTDIYFAPKAPAGKQSNWIPTKPGVRFEVLFRLYGPEKAVFDKTWRLPDIEEVAADQAQQAA
jgi:hypothetical protein